MSEGDVTLIVILWVLAGLLSGIAAAVRIDNDRRFTNEARVFVVVLAGFLAPLMVLVGLLWLLRRGVPAAVRATGRGARDAWRAVRPQREPKPEVPRAKVVRR